MKELTQQTIECKYEKDIREYCDHGTLGKVSVRSFAYGDVYGEFGDEDLAEMIDSLPKLECVMELEEPCNCFDEYGGPMHNDGGNYHSRIKLKLFYPIEVANENSIKLGKLSQKTKWRTFSPTFKKIKFIRSNPKLL